MATARPRAELSQFLVKPAEKAVKAHDLARAIPLYEALAVARGAGSPEQRQLALLWDVAGHHEQAAAAWQAFADAATDEDARKDARAEVTRLAAQPDPFTDRVELAALAPEARQAIALGRAAFARKQYGDALVYFHMGYALAPELPGFVRELGATYDKLGATDAKREFYQRYLVQRPFGPNADLARAALAKDKDALGTLIVSSSLPCSELWLNRERIPQEGTRTPHRPGPITYGVPGNLPAKGLAVAPGRYKGLCFNPKYEMALFEYATVEPGKPAEMAFRWAIVVNQLEHPYGRIALENAESPGTMIDLGITSPEIGVAVPADGHKLKMRLEDDTGTRTEDRLVQIAPGQRLVVTW